MFDLGYTTLRSIIIRYDRVGEEYTEGRSGITEWTPSEAQAIVTCYSKRSISCVVVL